MLPTRLWADATVEDGDALAKAGLEAVDKLRR